MANLSPAQLLLARTPPTPSTAAATSLSTSSRPRSSNYLASSANSSAPHSSARRGTLLDGSPSSGLYHGHHHPSASGQAFHIHPTFSPSARNPGTVKVLVQDAVFYVHRDVLTFGSSFFEALLTGDWAETDSVNGETGAPSYVGGTDGLDMPERKWSRYTKGTSPHRSPVETTSNAYGTSICDVPDSPEHTPILTSPLSPLHQELDSLIPEPDGHAPPDPALTYVETNEAQDTATMATSFVDEMQEIGVELQRIADGNAEDAVEMVGERTAYADDRKKVEARIILKEEQAGAFQDLLYFMYPHLDCVIHWNNVAALMTMSSKFDIPLLRSRCIAFLMESAAGKPIVAMSLAETHHLPKLYREASRFLLDSWFVWTADDLSLLSEATLLKLEKRRNWFLERLLKLGMMINTQRDYVCCSTCPDPNICASRLEEKWRSAWSSVFRYGSSPTPQPSYIWKSLRMLEPSLTSPPLHLTHTSCQNHARAWIADLFDRMFSLGGNTVNLSNQRGYPLTSSAANRPSSQDTAANRKYFLYVDYKA